MSNMLSVGEEMSDAFDSDGSIDEPTTTMEPNLMLVDNQERIFYFKYYEGRKPYSCIFKNECYN